MNALTNCALAQPATWQEGFLQLYARIEQYARNACRHLNAEAREDAVGEIVANTLTAYRRLYERGELQRAVPAALVRFAMRQYHDGRRVGSSQCCRDVYSPLARRKTRYDLCMLGAPGDQVGVWLDCLFDNRQSPVPVQAAFRIDFPRWLNSLPPRNRQIAERLSAGYSTQEVAKEFGVSQGRISQLRRELADSWHAFHEPVAARD